MRPSGNLPLCPKKSTGPSFGVPASAWIYSYGSTATTVRIFAKSGQILHCALQNTHDQENAIKMAMFIAFDQRNCYF